MGWMFYIAHACVEGGKTDGQAGGIHDRLRFCDKSGRVGMTEGESDHVQSAPLVRDGIDYLQGNPYKDLASDIL